MLTQVYESVKPPSGNGKLLWHALGAKTIELVHENVHLETVRDDLDTLVMDAEVLEGLLDAKDPDKKSGEIEIKLIARLRKVIYVKYQVKDQDLFDKTFGYIRQYY